MTVRIDRLERGFDPRTQTSTPVYGGRGRRTGVKVGIWGLEK
jgi:hypothetical protein